MSATRGAPATAAAMRDRGMIPVKTPRIRRRGITPVFSLRWRRSTSRLVSGRSAMGASGDAELEIEAEPNAADVEGNVATCADRKSTRLNSSHSQISYAVFCLKKKKKQMTCTIWERL